MVTQNGDHTVGLVVRVELFLHSGVVERLVIELFLESD